jgi:hypothetical protein
MGYWGITKERAGTTMCDVEGIIGAETWKSEGDR